MAVVKAFKWMRLLSDADEIRKKKEKTKDRSSLDMQSYQESVCLRNMAFVELLKAGIPFIYIEDDDIVRISLDETIYDIDTVSLKSFLTEEEYVNLINKTDFEEGFNPDKDINEEPQVYDEFEALKNKILSYGQSVNEDADYKESRNSSNFETTFQEEIKDTTKFEEEYKENYNHESDIIDYRIDKDGRAKIVDTTEYGIMGVEHGIGTTHTAMMLATYLAKDTTKSVALVEINNSNNMRDLAEWVTGEKIETNNYPLGNIDIYFGVDYLTFTAMYKDNYDYVVVDFGCYNKKREVIKEYIRIKNKFIVASGIDWNLPTLEDFYEDFIVDRSHTAVYLIPYLNDEMLIPIERIVKPNKVKGIPFNLNPFELSNETEAFLQELIGEEKLKLVDKQNIKQRPGLLANIFRN